MLTKVEYVLDELRKNYRDAYWWRQRFADRINGPLQEALEDDPGIDVMAEDWDNLLVLDACRHDLFENACDIDRFDDYRVVRSRGSATPEWMQENFEGQRFGDTVYVSGNPWISKIAPNSFHDIKNIWLEEYDIRQEDLQEVELLSELDMSFGATITAESVNEAALEAAAEYEDKRFIVHYFQPHAPFIGNADGTHKDPEDIDDSHPGRPLKNGEVTREAVWGGYRENFEYVWHHASKLVEQLDGTTVITSDHGEMFGERLFPIPIRGYAHPIGVRAPELVEVPWAVINGSRRRIVDEGTRHVTVDSNVVNERLADLGYKQ